MRTPASPPAASEPGPTDMHAGLSNEQVEARRHQYGLNEVLERTPNAVLTFLSKFWGLSAWMLEAITALSWTLHRYADVVIAASLLVLNVQERRAEGVVDTLRRLQVNARILRDGHWQTLPARELVPGDVTRIRQGDVVPADIRLISGILSVDQSVLTGESQDVDKAADAIVYSGSVIRRGEATGVVTATGAHVLRPHHGARADRATDTPRGGAGVVPRPLAVCHRRRRSVGDRGDRDRAAFRWLTLCRCCSHSCSAPCPLPCQ